MAVSHIKIESITESPDVQVRVKGVRPALVAEYLEVLNGGGELDPIWLTTDDAGTIILADGAHRVQAYREAGREKIPANPIEEGGISRALEICLERNGRHGEKLTSADKRNGVGKTLADTRMRRFSDRRVATLCGVSPALVASVRAGEAPKPRTRKEEPAPDPIANTKAASATKEPAADPAPSGGGSAPALQPVTTRERKDPEPTKIETIDDRLKAIKDWMKQGYMDLPAICASIDTKTTRLVMITKKKPIVRITEEGVIVKQFTCKSLDIVDGAIQVELENGEVMP